MEIIKCGQNVAILILEKAPHSTVLGR